MFFLFLPPLLFVGKRHRVNPMFSLFKMYLIIFLNWVSNKRYVMLHTQHPKVHWTLSETKSVSF